METAFDIISLVLFIVVILLGIGVWLYRQDRRLNRLEDAQRKS